MVVAYYRGTSLELMVGCWAKQAEDPTGQRKLNLGNPKAQGQRGGPVGATRRTSQRDCRVNCGL